MTLVETWTASLARMWFLARDEAHQATLRFGLWWLGIAGPLSAVWLHGSDDAPVVTRTSTLQGVSSALLGGLIVAALIAGAGLFVRARDTGELDTMLSGPVRRAELLLGKLAGIYALVTTLWITVHVGFTVLAAAFEVSTQHHAYALGDTLVGLLTTVTYGAAFGLVLRNTLGGTLAVVMLGVGRNALFNEGTAPEGLLHQAAVAVCGPPLGLDMNGVFYGTRELSVALPYVLGSWLDACLASALCLTLAYGLWTRRDAAS